MKPKKSASRLTQTRQIAGLRARLAEAEETLLAIRNGEVDAVVVAGKQGAQVFTLEGADHPYRVLIESMKGGALTLSANAVILYANQYFAEMIKRPLDQVLGSSFFSFLAPVDQAVLKPLLKGRTKTGSNMQAFLRAHDGSLIPAQISLRPLEKQTFNQATIGLVVTDMTEARRNEEMLRALTHRVVQVQESERGRVAFELHDGITQLLCGILFHSEALVASLTSDNANAMKAAMKLSAMAAKTAEEVERISRNLRPSVLENLGLTAALRETATEFAKRTNLPVKLDCEDLAARLPVDTELALYRILQEALRNIEKHSHAKSVKVRLSIRGDTIQLKIKDDGIGFNPDRLPVRRKGKSGLGLLSMRERANHLGGTVKLKSMLIGGTEIEVRIPLRPIKSPA